MHRDRWASTCRDDKTICKKFLRSACPYGGHRPPNSCARSLIYKQGKPKRRRRWVKRPPEGSAAPGPRWVSAGLVSDRWRLLHCNFSLCRIITARLILSVWQWRLVLLNFSGGRKITISRTPPSVGRITHTPPEKFSTSHHCQISLCCDNSAKWRIAMQKLTLNSF